MKKSVFFILFFLACMCAIAKACINDFDCKFGDVCVKPEDSISLSGVCVTPVDEFGNKTYELPTPEAVPHEISDCQFNTDCDIGFSCMKKSGELYGICMK